MPEIDTDLSSLWWLKPRQGGPDRTMEGLALGAQIQQRNRDYALKLADFHLQEKEQNLRMKSQLISNALNLQKFDDMDKEMSDTMTLNNWAKDPSQPMPTDFQHPKSFEKAAQIQSIYDKTQAGRAIQEAHNAYYKKIEQMTETDRITVAAMMRESKGAVNPEIAKYIDDSIERSPGKKPVQVIETEAMTKKLNDAQRAEDEGNLPKAEQLRNEAELLKAKFLGPSEQTEVVTNPQGGSTIRVTKAPFLKKGAGSGSELTTATKTILERDINSTRQNLGLMSDLEKNLRAQDVGFYGVVGENVMDKLLPQFGVNSLDPKRTDNRTKLRELIQSMMRQVSQENRFSNLEIGRIEQIMPSIHKLENVDHAKQVLRTLTDIFSDRNMRDRIALGQPIKMPDLTNEEIGAGVRLNVFSWEDAKKFLMENR